MHADGSPLRGTHRPRRGTGLRLPRLPAPGADLRARRPRRAGRRAAPARDRPCGGASRRPSGWRTRATSPWRWTATRRPRGLCHLTPGRRSGAASSSPDRARQVCDALFSNEMFSGWGIRTLSSRRSDLLPPRLSPRDGLAPRQRHHRPRPQALRHGGRGQRDRHSRSSTPRSTSRAIVCRS